MNNFKRDSPSWKMPIKTEKLWFLIWKKRLQSSNKITFKWKNNSKIARKNGNNCWMSSKSKVSVCSNRMWKLRRARNESMDRECTKAQRFTTAIDWHFTNYGVRRWIKWNVPNALLRCLSCYNELSTGALCTYLPCSHLFHK